MMDIHEDGFEVGDEGYFLDGEDMGSENPLIAYMCKVDFDWHVGQDAQHFIAYIDLDDLKSERVCVVRCGIVKIEITEDLSSHGKQAFVSSQDFNISSVFRVNLHSGPKEAGLNPVDVKVVLLEVVQDEDYSSLTND